MQNTVKFTVIQSVLLTENMIAKGYKIQSVQDESIEFYQPNSGFVTETRIFPDGSYKIKVSNDESTCRFIKNEPTVEEFQFSNPDFYYELENKIQKMKNVL